MDDDKVYVKLQGHWIIEMSEMLATSNAKSIEEIRSFISRQKETYRTPYDTYPKIDCVRVCSAVPLTHWIFSRWTELKPTFSSCHGLSGKCRGSYPEK